MEGAGQAQSRSLIGLLECPVSILRIPVSLNINSGKH